MPQGFAVASVKEKAVATIKKKAAKGKRKR
jgi:hypothetical protein